MAQKKKSRKVGQIGVRSTPKQDRGPNTSSGRPKKRVGRPAGSRHSAADQAVHSSVGGAKADPRSGSKKPISLLVQDDSKAKQTSKAKASKRYFSPQQELQALENDGRLQTLLDKLDNGVSLSAEDQQYVDQNMARHQQLCQLLGIEDQAEPAEDHAEDPLDKLDAFKMDDFR